MPPSRTCESRGKAQGIVHIFWNLTYIPRALVGGMVAQTNPGLTFPIAAVMYLLVMLYVFYDLQNSSKCWHVHQNISEVQY